MFKVSCCRAGRPDLLLEFGYFSDAKRLAGDSKATVGLAGSGSQKEYHAGDSIRVRRLGASQCTND